jgi:hypothetical protein
MTTLRIDRIGQNAGVRAARPRMEIELLLHCASTSLDTKAFERTETLLHREIDWAVLIETALRHGVVPLLYRNLRTHFREFVPGAAMDQLQFHSNAIGLRSLFLTQELLRLLNLLDAHDIPAIPYKGPVLAVSVYKNLSLRQFGDLDILVHPHHVPKAKKLLESQGYGLLEKLTGAQEAAQVQSHPEYRFERKDGQVVVELRWLITAHWQLLSSFPLNPNHLWERCEHISLAGATVRSLLPEDLLLILCVHGASHHWERLLWICDIAELIRAHRGLDLGQVLGQAKRLGSERLVLLALFLAFDLLGADLPEKVVQRVEDDSKVKSLAMQVRKWLFREPDAGLELFEEAAFFIGTRERLRDRIPYGLFYLRAFLRTVITPNEKDQALLQLPVSLSFLYYLLRPVRLFYARGLCPLRQRIRTQRP